MRVKNRNTAPKVSVIIPVYNTEKYLRQCLDSVVNQTLKEIEIICVDDGSTDGSLDILREYEKADDRVVVLTQENLNAGAARNKGLKIAAGQYLSFLDADDFFELDMLEKAYAKAVDSKADIVVFRSDFFYEDTQTFEDGAWTIDERLLPANNPFAGTDIEKNIFSVFVGWAWDKLFDASFVRENQLFFQEQRTTNDMLFVYSAVAKAGRISVMEDVFAHQRRKGGESLSVTREKSWQCFYNALLALKRQLEAWDLYTRFEQDFINYSLNFAIWHLTTLKQPAQELLFDRLKNEWFEQLNIPKHDETYFYGSAEYQMYQAIMQRDYSEWVTWREQQEAERREAERQAAEQALLESSWSYRIGRGITFIPRKIRGGVRCWRENGLRYTCVRFKEKLRNKFLNIVHK
jgi:glycosyltransferase involved in cell wall biosynthesis